MKSEWSKKNKDGPMVNAAAVDDDDNDNKALGNHLTITSKTKFN